MSVEIVICPVCEGHGMYMKEINIDLDPVKETCTRCQGSGRLKRTVTFEPYPLPPDWKPSKYNVN